MCGVTKKQSISKSMTFWLRIGLMIGLTIAIMGFSVAAPEIGEGEGESASASTTGKRVMMLIGDAQDFRGCEKLGSVKGASQESDNEKPYPQRLIIARTNLQQETANLGGNTVHVLRSNTARFEVPGVTKQIEFHGVAYHCE